MRGIGLGCLRFYCGRLATGKIAGDAVPAKSRPAPALIRVDAADGFAHPAYEMAEDTLIGTANAYGIALLSITNAHACGVPGTSRDVSRGPS